MSDRQTTTRPLSVKLYQGFAAKDIEKDKIDLAILCPELFPNTAEGTLNAGVTTGTIKLKNRDGQDISSSFTSANHITAVWEGASNMKYPPLIRKGEPVELYQVADQDKWFWRTTGKGKVFRTTDRVHFEISATDPTKPGVENDDTNSYTIYADSDEKKIGIKTSKANGEAMAFVMEADLAAGTFYIADQGGNPGNSLFMDTGGASGVPAFQISLSSGVALKFEGENAFLKIPKNFFVSAGDRIVMDSPLMVFNRQKSGTIIFNAATIAFKSASDIVFDAIVVGLNTTSTKIVGILAAASAKITNLIKAPVNGQYNGASCDRPEETPATTPNNSPDTSMTGTPYT